MWPSCGLKLASPSIIDVKKEIGMYMGTALSKSLIAGVGKILQIILLLLMVKKELEYYGSCTVGN
jgi:hypothetical protein